MQLFQSYTDHFKVQLWKPNTALTSIIFRIATQLHYKMICLKAIFLNRKFISTDNPFMFAYTEAYG